MRFREAAQSHRGLRALALSVVIAATAGVAGCGEDDFENEPRPAIPVELTAAIDKNGVSIAPSDPGAGLVVVTISNQTDDSTQLVLEGPTEASSGEIPPGGTGQIKTALEEGDYEASTGDSLSAIKPADLTVGPARESSQNELLQP